MAVLVRSTTLQLPTLQRALHAAGVPTVVHGEDLPLHLQPAVAPLLLLLRCALEPERLDEEAAVALLHSPLGGADPLAERRLRQGLRALALAGGDRRPSGELLVEALRDPTELAGIDRRWAEPAQAVAGLLATAREAAAQPGATAEHVLWAVWRGQRPGRAVGRRDRPGAAGGRRGRPGPATGGPRRPTGTWTPCWCSSTRRPASSTGCPARAPRSSSTTCSARICRPTRIAPTADRGEAVRLLTAHAAKGLEWDLVARGRRPGGHLARPAPARQPARLGAAGRRAGRPGRRAAPAPPTWWARPRRCSTRSAGSSTSRSAGPGADCWSPRSRRRRSAATTTRSSRAGSSTSWARPRRPPRRTTPGRRPARAARPAYRPAGRRPAGGPPTAVGAGGSAGTGGSGGARTATDDSGGAIRRCDRTAVRATAGAAGADEAGEPDGPGALPVTRPPRALTLPALVAELRTAVTDPAGAGDPAARRGGRAGPARRRRRARRAPGRLVGAARRSPTTGRWSTRASRSGSPRRRWRAPCGAACAGCWNGTAAAARPAPPRASATWCTPPRCSPRTPAPTGSALVEYVAARFDAIELAARWMAGPERERAEAMVDKLLRWLAANPRRLLAIEHEFAVRLDDPTAADRADRPGRPAGGGRGRPAGGDRPEDRQVHRRHRRRAGRASAARRLPGGGRGGGVRRVRRRSPAAPRWCSSAPAAKDAREQNQPPPGEGRRPAGRRRWSAAPPIRWPPPPSRPWPTRKCRVCPVRTSCPVSGRGARSSSRRPSEGREARSDRCRAERHSDPAHPVRRRTGADAPHAPTPAPATPRWSWPNCCGCRRRPGSRPRSSRRRWSRCWWSRGPAPARPRRWPPGWSGWSPTRTCGPEQILGLTFTRKAAGELAHRVRTRLDQLVRRLGRQGRDPLDDPLAGEPTVSTYHSYAGADRHRARAAGRLRAVHPAAHRGVPVAARRPAGAQLRRRHVRGGPDAEHHHRRGAGARRRAGRAPGRPGRAGRLDRPVLRRGAVPARPGLRRRAQGARRCSRPG